MFLHHELGQVQSHITERHEVAIKQFLLYILYFRCLLKYYLLKFQWSPGVRGSKADDGRMNLIHLVDEPMVTDQV